VDDDPVNIFSLQAALEAEGLHIITADSGQQALDQLQNDPQISVVLMDIQMPEMDGYTAIGHIRSNPSWKGLPVIALTAKAMKGDREKCLEAGASDYLAKPVDVERLIAKIRYWMDQWQQESA